MFSQKKLLDNIVAEYRSLAWCGDDWKRGLLHLGLIQDAEDQAIAAGFTQKEITAHVEAELKLEMVTRNGEVAA